MNYKIKKTNWKSHWCNFDLLKKIKQWIYWRWMSPQTCSSLRVCSRYVEHKNWTLPLQVQGWLWGHEADQSCVLALNPSGGQYREPWTAWMWSSLSVLARTRAVALWVSCSRLIVLLQGPVNTPLQQSSRLKINSRSSFPDPHMSPLILHMVLRWQ